MTLRLPSLACLIAAAGLAGGCSCEKTDDDANAPESLAGVELHLFVADDPALAVAISQIRGEWNAATESTLRVTETTVEELLAAKTIDADAVIFPSALLGPFVEAKKITRLERDWLTHEQLDWPDVFELIRRQECCWGDAAEGRTYALPLGSPVLVCAYRADLLAALDLAPPQTWSEYADLAKALGDRARLGKLAPPDDAVWSGTLEPLGPGWASLVLLARAAPYARHRDEYSTLFDIDTMEPLVDRPCFVRALEQLVEAASSDTVSSNAVSSNAVSSNTGRCLQTTPADAAAALLGGECGMTLTWLSAAESFAAETAHKTVRFPIGVCELPGSAEVFRFRQNQWEPRREGEDSRAPLLAVSGRLGSVCATSKHPHAAFRMLAWLSNRDAGGRSGGRPSTASGQTTVFRRSQLGSAANWAPRDAPPKLARRYAAVVQQTLSHSRFLFALRISGRAEYLAALDAAVRDAVLNKRSPAESLDQAAVEWRTITEKLGRESQRAAYQRSLGMEP